MSAVGGAETAPVSHPFHQAIRVLKAALILYIPLSFTVLAPPSTFHLVIGYTGAVLVVFFLEQLAAPGSGRRLWNGFNLLCALVSSCYFLIQVERLSMPLGAPPDADYWMGLALILAVVEASRKTLGWIMPTIAIVLATYDVLGRFMPGILYHPGISVSRAVFQLTGSLQGPYGQIPTIIVEVVAMFLVFGAVVQGGGIADFFGSLTHWISGRIKSGAGLTAVSMSALFGAITGAPVANVGTTGSFTIPLMKRAGFSAEQAAAIEGVASTGSQIIPPILGTAAFLMAQFINKPYSHIAAVSIFPSMLFVMTVLLTVHALGMRSDTKPVVFEGELRASWAKSYLLIPVFALVAALMYGFSPEYSAFVATVATLALFAVELTIKTRRRGGARLGAALRPMLMHLERTADAVVVIVVAGAVIGIIVTLLSIPLTVQRLSGAAIEMAGGSLTIILVIVAVAAIILGTGLPTVATYVLVVLLFAPTIVQLGVDPLSAHMFVFYLGVAADITPPVAMAVLAAAGIARANFWRSALIALRLGFSIFLLPFLFVLQPEILRTPVDAPSWLAYASVTVGMAAAVAGLTGYFFGTVRWPLRALFLAVAAVGFWPTRQIWIPITSIVGFVLCFAACRMNRRPPLPQPVTDAK